MCDDNNDDDDSVLRRMLLHSYKTHTRGCKKLEILLLLLSLLLESNPLR